MKNRTSIAVLLLALAAGSIQAAFAQAPSKAADAKTGGNAESTKSKAKGPEKPVDINNASEKELMTLPRVGAKLAKEIIAARPFQSVDELKRVKGIGDSNFAQIKDYIICNPPKK